MTKQNDKVFSITDTVLQNSTDIKEHVELEKITELRLNAQLKSLQSLDSEIESLKKQVKSLTNSNYERKIYTMQFKNATTEFLNTRKNEDVSQVQATICNDLNLQALQILEFACKVTISQRVHEHTEQSCVNASADISECYHHTHQDIES